MKTLIYLILSFCFLVSNSYAEDNRVLKLDSLDFKLKIGQYELSAPYKFAGDIVLNEGYLISVADLALLKVEIDSFETTMQSNIELFSKQCQSELLKCQEDADDRFIHLVKENEFLSEKLDLQTELYETQKTKTIIYTVSAIVATGVTSFLIVKMVY